MKTKIPWSKNDEWTTPEYAVRAIAKHLKPGVKVWAPFDESASAFARVLGETNEIRTSHINDGVDFFSDKATRKYAEWADVIVSNPPYSRKYDVIERCYELDKPFALLIGFDGIFDSKKRFEFFKEHEFELLILGGRVSYMSDGEELKGSPPYQSIYLCNGILDARIKFEKIKK